MKFITLLLLPLVLTSCYTPERKCKKFQKGTFEYSEIIGGKIETTKFVRNDSIEIDYFRSKADTSSIRWVNDCECILKNLNPKNRSEEKPLHIKILTTEKNNYTFEYGLVGSAKKQKGNATKID